MKLGRYTESAVPEQSSDEALLLAAARGDRAAFADLYDRSASLLFGVVRRVVRDPAQSEEVTQEAFTEIWRAAPTFDPDRGLARSWMLTIAHRRAIDRVRSEQAARDRVERVGQRDHVPDYDHVSEQVEESLEHEQVRTSLASLTDLQREAVELAYYGGCTYREVAELLDTPLGTIKTEIREALIRLRDVMGVSR